MKDEPNIVLCGYMGTGKTAVGRLLAARMGRPFVDLDQHLEERFGCTISEVFREQGEGAFRAAESALIAELGTQTGMVIATGGGAVLDPANREALAEHGVMICLWAGVDTLVERLKSDDSRPLLKGELRSRIVEMLDERRPVYQSLTHHLDTTSYAPVELVPKILDLLEGEQEVPGMTRITVEHPSGSYHIALGEGLLSGVGKLLARRGIRVGRVAVVSNTTVAPLYAETLLDGLSEAGYEPVLLTVPDGEDYKTLDTVRTLYDGLLEAGMGRKNAVISLGGGVVGDMAGFVAASFMRGVPFVQIPTSLLAMVDASVGGKTGVDLPQGKNLVGAFKQPEIVVVDVDVLATLEPEEFRSGLAEVVKHGIIGAPELFEQLSRGEVGELRYLVSEAVRVKVAVVESDPFEAGRRAILNLGHTFGHAIEQVSGYSVRHGYAVAIGMVAAARLGVLIEACQPELLEAIEGTLEALDLPTRVENLELDALMRATTHDKKKVGKTLRFLIPTRIGQVTIINDPGPELVRQAFVYVGAQEAEA